MKLQKRSPNKDYETIYSKGLTSHILDGNLVVSFYQCDGRKCDHRIIFTANELIDLASRAVKAASGNAPVDLRVTWKPRK